MLPLSGVRPHLQPTNRWRRTQGIGFVERARRPQRRRARWRCNIVQIWSSDSRHMTRKRRPEAPCRLWAQRGRRRRCPIRFVRELLKEDPYDKQEEILRAVATARRVSVVGCNGSGKDWAAARAVLWWMHSRSPVKAIVTGPTTRQVDDIVWNELRFAYGQASEALGGRMFRTSRYELDERSFALGFATNSPYTSRAFTRRTCLWC